MSENPLMSLFRQSEKDRRPYSQTLEKGMLWPVVKSGYTGKPEWSTEGGLIGSAIDAFTLPGRVYNGEVAPDDPGEMINFVGNVLGGGGMARAGAKRSTPTAPARSMPLAAPPSNSPKPEPGMIAHHVSPHDFNAFKSSEIGNGIGAQTEGRGLYFTTSRRLIDAYADDMDLPHKYDVRINASRDKFLNWDDLESAMQQRLSTKEGTDEAVKNGYAGVIAKNTGRGYEGTENYTVFDDKLIEILRKYGLLGGVVGGGAMAGGTDAQASSQSSDDEYRSRLSRALLNWGY